MNYFVHAHAICESQTIGARTRVWAFAHVLPRASLGEDCNICDGVFIENDVVVGNRVTIKCGVQLWDGLRLDDDVFIGPNVTFTNDRFPRSKQYPESFAQTHVCQGASIGANSTILPGITIGRNAMIGAGAVVTKSVPPNAIVVGNPAGIVGYVDAREPPEELKNPAGTERVEILDPSGVTMRRLQRESDLRGDFSSGDFLEDVPFSPKRYTLVLDVPGPEIRHEYAHRKCEQFLVCVRGACTVTIDTGSRRLGVRLDRPDLGLHLPPMIWVAQSRWSPDAVLLAFGSEYDDPDDCIRDHSQFLAAKQAASADFKAPQT